MGVMPKEVLHDDSGLRALVKWRRDREHEEHPNTPGHVQIATVNPGIDDPDMTGAAGWYVDLDADQIDYLIAVLRKAKRQAFPNETRHPVRVVDASDEFPSEEHLQWMRDQVNQLGAKQARTL